MNPHLKHSLIIFTATALISWAWVAWGGNMTLIKVEKLTETEQSEIEEIKKDIRVAEDKLKILQQRITENHGCKKESYMEWETSVRFDGQFILLYHLNKMAGLSSILSGSAPASGTTFFFLSKEGEVKISK